jgi:hypothetical protein
MWIPTTLSALWLAACAVGVNAADPDIKSIPVRQPEIARRVELR